MVDTGLLVVHNEGMADTDPDPTEWVTTYLRYDGGGKWAKTHSTDFGSGGWVRLVSENQANRIFTSVRTALDGSVVVEVYDGDCQTEMWYDRAELDWLIGSLTTARDRPIRRG